MRPEDLTMKRGDTRPDVVLEPLDGTGALVNMVDPPLGPLTSVEFHLRKPGEATELALAGTASVEGAGTANFLRYRWDDADTADLVGEYAGEFEVVYADGGRETFPNGRDLKIVFNADVESGGEP
jgi:hypothetical protein